MIDLSGPASVQKKANIDINTPVAKTQETRNLTANVDAFLQLLVTQLATFASVEQSVQMNANLASLSAQSGLSQASDLVGRLVVSADGATSGVIRAVKTGPDGLSALLQDGNIVPLRPGVTIGEK